METGNRHAERPAEQETGWRWLSSSISRYKLYIAVLVVLQQIDVTGPNASARPACARGGWEWAHLGDVGVNLDVRQIRG